VVTDRARRLLAVVGELISGAGRHRRHSGAAFCVVRQADLVSDDAVERFWDRLARVKGSSRVLGRVARAMVVGLVALAAAAVVPLRRAITRWGATEAELRAAWPGDGLVDRPKFIWTNAVTVNGPAGDVWPWLVQLGQGRGGLYSYDWLENLVGCDVHTTDRVIPELQVPLKVGDRLVRMARYAPFNPVAFVDPGHALVLGGVHDSDDDLRAGRASSTWAFIAEPVDDQTCRLVVRSRGRSVMARLQAPLQFLMQRKMMLGIKQRVEASARGNDCA